MLWNPEVEDEAILLAADSLTRHLVKDKDTVMVAMGGPGGSRETDYHGVRGEIF